MLAPVCLSSGLCYEPITLSGVIPIEAPHPYGNDLGDLSSAAGEWSHELSTTVCELRFDLRLFCDVRRAVTLIHDIDWRMSKLPEITSLSWWQCDDWRTRVYDPLVSQLTELRKISLSLAERSNSLVLRSFAKAIDELFDRSSIRGALSSSCVVRDGELLAEPTPTQRAQAQHCEVSSGWQYSLFAVPVVALGVALGNCVPGAFGLAGLAGGITVAKLFVKLLVKEESHWWCSYVGRLKIRALVGDTELFSMIQRCKIFAGLLEQVDEF